MALKKRIKLSYQWRIFMPVLISFWLIIISMAFWQIYRVREVRIKLVYDQLVLVGESMAYFLDHNQEDYVDPLLEFINYYNRLQERYDAIGIQVRDKNGKVLLKTQNYLPENMIIPKETADDNLLDIYDDLPEVHSGKLRYIYYTTGTSDGKTVYVLLPYTKQVSKLLSASTRNFWLIFLAIGIIVTIFAYISSYYLSSSIKVLSKFAAYASDNENIEDLYEQAENLPHDEFGDVSRKIITLYSQRLEEIENREKEHRVAMHAIKEKERIKRELTSNINHELKTPVGVIQGYIDTLVDNPDMDAETHDRFLLKTQQSVHRLSQLILDVSTITRLDSGGKLVNLSEVNFHDIVFSFANYVKENELLKKGMKFYFNIPLDCIVLGNELLLTSVLTNLTKNASNYSNGTKCVLNCVKEDEDFYYFQYYDDGVGVAPENLPHMFERFYRVNAGRSRETGGTGLGLSIVQVTIESFGGKIEVDNHYPHGLEFNFCLQKHKRRPTPTPPPSE